MTSLGSMEEAANIAAEFISSLENLPHEIHHLLQEIRHKDSRAQELQAEIDADSARYIRSSIRLPSPGNSAGPSAASANLPAKISSSYAEIQRLSDEKCLISQRVVNLIARTRARLDVDLIKVGVLSGEVSDYAQITSASLAALNSAKNAHKINPDDHYLPGGRGPATQVVENLKNALAAQANLDVLQLNPSTSISLGPPVTKKRRLNGQGPERRAVKLASPAPSASTTTTHPRSRLSRQILPPRQPDQDMDVDADADAEGESDGEPEDQRLYCHCQRKSFGDMIACDNEKGCPYEWFHIACVDIKLPTPDVWYCKDCRKDVGGRKGRKK